MMQLLKFFTLVFLLVVGSWGGLGATTRPDAIEFLRYVEPRYPAQARRVGIQGYVIVDLFLEKDGKVTACEVVRAAPEGYFEDSVRQAAMKWQVNIDHLATPITKLRQQVTFALCDSRELCKNVRLRS
ncbi:MAG: energy transducer TonB [Bdellovibrionales bacterium]|nr:energy transducer TonB [Bdellovibrionales bacterium]